MKTLSQGTEAQAMNQDVGKWIELIRVRSSHAALEAAMPSLESQVAELEASMDSSEAHFLRHALYDGDLAVVLIWRGMTTRPAKTHAGLMVADQLQRLGSVDHAVWVPAGTMESRDRYTTAAWPPCPEDEP